jgi:hypothetical protein
MFEQLIQTQASAAEIVCKRLGPPHLKALQESIEEACRLPADEGWDRKAAAHAEFFSVLAEVANDPIVAPVLASGGELAYDLMVIAGCAADGIVTSSRRRFLECLRVGDVKGAAFEYGEHLRILHIMYRLTGRRHGVRRDGRPSGQDRTLIQSRDN